MTNWRSAPSAATKEAQLSLFGDDTPTVVPPAKSSNALSSVRTAPVTTRISAEPVTVEVEVMAPSRGFGPSAIDREITAYTLYADARREARWLSTVAALLILATILVVQFSAVTGDLPLDVPDRRVLVGLLGWCSLVCTGYALFSIVLAARLKRRCGVFFRGIITFADNPFVSLLDYGLVVVHVGLLGSFLAVVLILAHAEMMFFVLSIFNGALRELVMPPWTEPTIVPTQ